MNAKFNWKTLEKSPLERQIAAERYY